jgi:hypothetical protein
MKESLEIQKARREGAINMIHNIAKWEGFDDNLKKFYVEKAQMLFRVSYETLREEDDPHGNEIKWRVYDGIIQFQNGGMWLDTMVDDAPLITPERVLLIASLLNMPYKVVTE